MGPSKCQMLSCEALEIYYTFLLQESDVGMKQVPTNKIIHSPLVSIYRGEDKMFAE